MNTEIQARSIAEVEIRLMVDWARLVTLKDLVWDTFQLLSLTQFTYTLDWDMRKKKQKTKNWSKVF